VNSGQSAFLVLTHFHEPHFPANVRQGMAGMLRRMSDGGAMYSHARCRMPSVGSDRMMGLHTYILWAASVCCCRQIPFIINLFWSINSGKKVTSDNPWEATTLEWQAPDAATARQLRPSRRKFIGDRTRRSVPGHEKDYTPQNEPEKNVKSISWNLYAVEPRQDTGLYNAKLGIWLVSGLEVMLFAPLFL